ncbi:gag-pol fusion poly [Labeo rohita]|uniref:Gag-pol fusion poly n=1 Tax=Labeo rohita TaxID=84645 RepID=A0A498NW30_LABRO|nr:gag-pol fusion poly [Labeo rohita]
MVLPNQMHDDDNKALGLGYSTEEDMLYVMTSVNFSKRKKKMRLGQNLLQEQVRAQTPNPLTRRELLSQVSGVYDPVGLVTPTKQKGAILVRKAFQEAKKRGVPVSETWDAALSDELREEAIRLFEEYVQLGQIKFTRAITPPNSNDEAWAITFSDGSENAYGAVLYLRWHSNQGSIIRLVESKAKLTPLDQKGDVIKAEVCGAVFASRLRRYFEQHSRIRVEKWYHLVDSQTVLGAIQRESYGYKTFFANRIGEIQGVTKAQEWWWIPGLQNIADVITRGASPQNLDENSEWQNGPSFLSLPVDEWPIKSAKDLAGTARESIKELQKKAFAAALTRSEAKQKEPTGESEQTGYLNQVQAEPRRPPAGLAVRNLCDLKRFSDLSRLVKTIAWVWRAAKKFLGKNRTLNNPKWEAVCSTGTISVRERGDALRDIFLAAQEGINLPNTTRDRLVVYKDQHSGLLVCGGRVQVFEDDQVGVPVLPYDAWVSTLLARESHKESHGGLADTVLRMRRKAWVIRGRRIAQKVINNCVQCRKNRAKKCQQVMGDLPPERTQPTAPFEFTTVDLFGPYHVKDDVKKRTSLKVWGVVFCCMSSRAIHTELVNTQSTEGFLMAFQRFAAIRGYPKKIYSDPGTNFIGARPVLQELYKFLERVDKSALEETAAKNGTEWIWKIHPADSPHRNGAAEAAVRIVKKALQNCGGESALTYSEFQTALQIAANLANERPIDARAQSREDCIQYVTPNTLLLGRASQSGDIKSFDFCSYPFKRLQAMQLVVDNFWRRWSQLAGPNLFLRNKWHTAHRNVAVGDIVWIADQNALRGQFKLGRVVSVNPDNKGVVRDVDVRTFPSYPVPITKPLKAKANYTESKSCREKIPSTVLHRDVRRLVVLLPVEDQVNE